MLGNKVQLQACLNTGLLLGLAFIIDVGWPGEPLVVRYKVETDILVNVCLFSMVVAVAGLGGFLRSGGCRCTDGTCEHEHLQSWEWRYALLTPHNLCYG